MAESTSYVDVLIIGAGPAGLMLALWLSRLGIKTRIVDKRTEKVYSGQADGIQVRTLEILDSFGIGERVWREANHMMEVCFWNPDGQGHIRRDARAPDVKPGLSRFCEVVLHQGRMEAFFLDAIRASSCPAEDGDGAGAGTGAEGRVRVERRVLPTSLDIDESEATDEDAFPVAVTLRHLSEEEATPVQVLSNMQDGLFRSNLADDDARPLFETTGRRERREETVRAKYVVGCDGAHSWTRKSLGDGFEMQGEMTDFIWGVLDIIPITNFPDIRNRTMVHSASSGSLMVIPRENRIVRLYIQLTEVSAGGGRVDRSKITPEMILKAAQRIISPYRLEYHYCDWWTAYQIGQRVGSHFSKFDRVFLAGDAVHTHSPKAGQGMNVSMQDTYNLGWKLGLVCKKILQRHVLSTYELERKQIAQQLIAFDHEFSRLFSGRPAKDIMDETGVSMGEFAKAFELSYMFTTAVGISYKPSVLVTKPPEEACDGDEPATDGENGHPQSTVSLATKCAPGTRFPSFQVLNQADATPWEFHHKMPSDGRFRVFVFAGDVAHAGRRDIVNKLGDWFSTTLLPKYPTVALSVGANPHGSTMKFRTAKDPSVIDVLLLHSARREDVELLRDFADIYHPHDPKLGYDYDKTFVDGPSYHDGHGQAYQNYGVDPAIGAMVVVRPDGYVGLVTSIEEEGRKNVELWFDRVLRTVA